MHPQSVHEVGWECSAGGQEGCAEGSGEAVSMGQGQSYEIQQGQVLGPAFWPNHPAELQSGGRVIGKLPDGKHLGVLVSSS